jgi:hypothetical protein
MSRSTITILIYIFGLIFGALFLGIWIADTNLLKALLCLAWTALFLVGLFFTKKMKKFNFIQATLFVGMLLIIPNKLSGEMIILSSCNNKADGFLKNEYILDLEKFILTRNYTFNQKTYKKYRMNDLSVKKENTIEQFIYMEDDLILTDKIGYPQFYTQLLFKIDDPKIKIKTVINNQEGITEMSVCEKIERFKKES